LIKKYEIIRHYPNDNKTEILAIANTYRIAINYVFKFGEVKIMDSGKICYYDTFRLKGDD
jgi:hypothetical protein